MKLEPKTKKPITLVTRLEHKSSQTLLEFLSKRFPYHNPDEWREHIQTGKIQVNGLSPSEGQPLRAGDEVAFTTQAWEEPEVNVNYRVVYEDETLLAISKPAPLPVHAIGAYFENTLMHLLRRDRAEAQNFNLVHRLDSETSGLILLAKDKKVLKALQKQWESGEVQKTYLAIVFGKFEPIKRRVDQPIGPLKESRIRMKLGINQENCRPSITDFECLKFKPSRTNFEIDKGGFSLVAAKPLTGRTHQIRVHLEASGFPIVGDKLYSGGEETFLHFIDKGWDDWLKEKVLLPRQALHAFKIEFCNPITGERVILEDSMPPDLEDFWNGL